FCVTACSVLLRHPPPPEIYTLSLHDALPICDAPVLGNGRIHDVSLDQPARAPGRPMARAVTTILLDAPPPPRAEKRRPDARREIDRKSTRLNSSHVKISYAVFCLKKKNKH